MRKIQQVEAALVGKRHIGRSRSAQYGLVDIQPCQYQSPKSYHMDKQDYVCVYADSRLVFYRSTDYDADSTTECRATRIGQRGNRFVGYVSKYVPFNMLLGISNDRHTIRIDLE